MQGQQARQQDTLNQQNIKANDLKLFQAATEQKSQEDIKAAFRKATPEMMLEGDPVKVAMKSAEILLANGAIGDGTEALKAAASIDRDRSMAQKAQLDTSIQEANVAAGILENVHDGPSLEAMAERVSVQGIDTKGVMPKLYQHYKQYGWDDSLQNTVEALRKVIYLGDTKAKIDLARARVETEVASQRLKHAQETILVPAQAEALLIRARNVGKTGGVKTAADKVNANLAKSFIERDWQVTDSYGEDDPAALNVFTDSVVQRASDIMQSTPAMKSSDAVDKAYRELKDEQTFAGYKPQERRPGSKYAPIPFSRDMKKEDLVVNDVYMVKGLPRVWDGTEFQLVTKGGR